MKVSIKDLASYGRWSDWIFEGTPKEVWRRAYRLARRWCGCGYDRKLNIGKFGYRLSVTTWAMDGQTPEVWPLIV